MQTLCTSLRRNAKEERVLFHYNGHGVPRPTDNGEIWVFNTVSRSLRPSGESIAIQRETGCYSVLMIATLSRNGLLNAPVDEYHRNVDTFCEVNHKTISVCAPI